MKKIIFILLTYLLIVNIISAEKENKQHKKSHLGIGLGISTKQFYKVSLYFVSQKGFGLDLTAATNNKHKDKEDNYYGNIDNITAENTLEDELLSSVTGKTLFFVNLIKRLYRNIYTFGGICFGTSQKYNKYYDSYHILGKNGKYWVEAEDKEKYWSCFDAGIRITVKEYFSFDISYMSKPETIFIGGNIDLSFE